MEILQKHAGGGLSGDNIHPHSFDQKIPLAAEDIDYAVRINIAAAFLKTGTVEASTADIFDDVAYGFGMHNYAIVNRNYPLAGSSLFHGNSSLRIAGMVCFHEKDNGFRHEFQFVNTTEPV
jgi:hypothetical protein